MLKRVVSGLGRRLRLLIELPQFFYTQRVKGFEAPTQPHLDDETLAWLTDQLRTSRSFVEFGCGGSTLLANQLAVPTISVESDRFYAVAVRSALPKPELTQILTPRMGITRQWGMPVFFRSRKGTRYVTAPFDRLGATFPDLIFVDGRYRVACALASAAQARRMGATAKLLIDDYAGRPDYHVVENYLGPPDRIGRAAMFMIGTQEIAEQAIFRHSTDAR